MEFVFLTTAEAEGANIHWVEGAPKPSRQVAAALAAGFSEEEVRESPLGMLEEDYCVSPALVFRRGARVLIGINGSTLIQVR